MCVHVLNSARPGWRNCIVGPLWLVVLCVFLPTLLVAGENLLTNPSFADGLKGWKSTFPESNEKRYSRNHDWVTIIPASEVSGKVMCFTLNSSVAASEGVKVCSDLIPVESGAEYEFGAEILRDAPKMKIFIEGYKKNAEYTETGNDRYPGYVRVYRKVLHVKSPVGKWDKVSQRFRPPMNHRPDMVLVKLYAYHPAGKVYWRNVFLRKVADRK